VKYFVDTEFNPRQGKAPELISLGAVDENDREFYGENLDFNLGGEEVEPWLFDNVFPHLTGPGYTEKKLIDDFIDYLNEGRENKKDPMEIYFWVGAYDWFIVWDLFTKHQVWKYKGANQIPGRHFRELKHLQEWLAPNLDVLDIETPGNVHNALDDSKWNKLVYEAIKKEVDFTAQRLDPEVGPHGGQTYSTVGLDI